MKSYPRAFAGLLAIFLALNPCPASEDIDLSGTWEGVIYLSDFDIDMEIILVIIEKNGTVSGHISDDWGYLNCDIADPIIKQNILTFKAMVETSTNDHQMAFRMKVAGDSMEGQWESLGSFGDLSLVKKKEFEEKAKEPLKIEDVVGVWKGPAAYKSNPGSKNVLTLVLEEKKGKLSGTFSDEFGTEYNRVVIKSFQDNTLGLEIEFTWENDTYVMDVDIALKDDWRMRGKFKIEKMGRTGIWTAAKQAVKR